jgi:nucleoside-diphosphate-sugar epimerase
VRIFITGATGHVGSAVAEAFRRTGHEVLALARTSSAADRVAAAGLHPVRGALEVPESYSAAARDSDVLVHAAFDYAGSGAERTDVDERAVETLLDAARAGAATHARPRQVIYTSNAYLLRAVEGRAVDETIDTAHPAIPPAWRFAVEQRVLAAGTADGSAAAPGASVGCAVVRLGLVYGGAGGSGPSLYEAARRRRAGVYSGAGASRMSLVHRADAATLYERIAAAGATGVFHAVDGEPLCARDVASAVSGAAGYGGRTLRVSGDEAAALLGAHTADIMERDVAVVAARSFALGWRPRFPSFRDGVAAALADWRAGAVEGAPGRHRR